MVTDPILKIPNGDKKKKCQWEKPVLCPSGNTTQGSKECEQWATKNCSDRQFTEMYCKDNNYCHFKPEGSDSDNSATTSLNVNSKTCGN